MTTIWLDVLTHKHALLLKEVGEYLRRRGFKVFYTARRMSTLTDFLNALSIDAEVVGSHGGRDLRRKLLQSLCRAKELVRVVLEKKPSLAISHGSPEAARVAFGLKIPHICILDSPHAEAVCRLTIPLSSHLLSTWAIPKKRWTPYLVGGCRLRTYRALDPALWIRGVEHQPEEEPLVVVRAEEYFASYMPRDVSAASLKLVKELGELCRRRKARVLVLARTETQAQRLERVAGEGVEVVYELFHGSQVLSRAWVFLGMGGTMTYEASLLGVPTVAFPPRKPTDLELFLAQRGLVSIVYSTSDAISRVESVLSNPEPAFRRQRKRAQKLWSRMSVADFYDKLQKCIDEAVQRSTTAIAEKADSS